MPQAEEYRVTYADYLALPNDGRRYEVLEGWLETTPAPGTHHQATLVQITVSIAPRVAELGLGKFLVAPTDVVLSESNVVQPDALFVRRDRLSIIREDAIHGSPDLVIEIVSRTSARRDLIDKRRIYAAHGIPEYWIVNTDAQSILVLVLTDGLCSELASVSGDVPIPSRALAQFSLRARELFPDR